ncbi:MerR family DNA-binding transcriptional regulator [Streptomyces cinnamoneus]|uniref:MerR family transcriptional regulator n=1 Tax=Streptomyces cinnamoneus TaxID=53446 RepID=UPI003F4D5E44
MAWPIAEVARMSGVTARALRHFDEIGEIDAQYRTLARIRAATAEEYRAIGRTCVENEHWHAVYEAIAPGLAAYQRAAVEAYAATRLR